MYVQKLISKYKFCKNRVTHQTSTKNKKKVAHKTLSCSFFINCGITYTLEFSSMY